MTIVRWTPFTELDSMERRMRRVFEEIGLAPALVPAADIYETDDEYVVELDVPGYEETELAIEVHDHTLSIRGEREKVAEEKTKERLKVEGEKAVADDVDFAPVVGKHEQALEYVTGNPILILLGDFAEEPADPCIDFGVIP